MTKTITNTTCYVFSPQTLTLAMQDWLNRDGNQPHAEADLIVVAAIPWFLQHIQHTTHVYMFSHEDMLAAIPTWKDLQLKAYPHQQTRIENTCEGIRDFFESEMIEQHKMTVHT